MPVKKPKKLVNHLVSRIRTFHKDCGLPTAQLDLSGGIDSAVMAGLLSQALGPENVYVLYSSINSSDESRHRARRVARVFGLKLAELDLTELYERFRDTLLEELSDFPEMRDKARTTRAEDATVDGSLRSCLRAPIGRYFNRVMGGGIRHGTGNEDEDRWIRFYQKGGDGEVDTNPLASLSKGEVYQIAVELGVPREIIEAMPTPDLQGVGKAHNDEEELKSLTGVDWTYSRVDPDTGQYTKVGSIEAMSRVLDKNEAAYILGGCTIERYLFHQHTMDETTLGKCHKAARRVSPMFEDFVAFKFYAMSARKLEASTRHKMNPNCPSIVTREELVDNGLLTNQLPSF